jgi:ubiquinone/menaquinone biosynthesis C-methylase UbiE
MTKASNGYLHALRYRWLTPAYDLVVRALVRERAFKRALIEQANIKPGQTIVDLGCGTGTLSLYFGPKNG